MPADKKKVVIAGSGNAALCAGIATLERGADALILEKASADEAGGNSRYTAGAMRFAYQSRDELLPLLRNPASAALDHTDFGSYPRSEFAADLSAVNDSKPLNELQQFLVDDSYDTMLWLSRHNIRFDPIYSRQAFQKDGRYVFWGGLVLEAQGEGVGLVEAELREFLRLGGQIQYDCECRELVTDESGVRGVLCNSPAGEIIVNADAVVLGCGGFEANTELRRRYLGEEWVNAKVRGTRHNTGGNVSRKTTITAIVRGNLRRCKRSASGSPI